LYGAVLCKVKKRIPRDNHDNNRRLKAYYSSVAACAPKVKIGVKQAKNDIILVWGSLFPPKLTRRKINCWRQELYTLRVLAKWPLKSGPFNGGRSAINMRLQAVIAIVMSVIVFAINYFFIFN